MKPETEKQAFELWARENIGQCDLSGKHVRNGMWSYNHSIVRLCWEAWESRGRTLVPAQEHKSIADRIVSEFIPVPKMGVVLDEAIVIANITEALDEAFACGRASQERMFPVLDGGQIPWSVAEVAYIEYANQYGKDQSLERLAERGGLHANELDALLPNWRVLAATPSTSGRPEVEDTKPAMERCKEEHSKHSPGWKDNCPYCNPYAAKYREWMEARGLSTEKQK